MMRVRITPIRKTGCLVMIACLLLFCPAVTRGAGPDVALAIHFLGGAQTIGGSACLIQSGPYRILIDFGAFPWEKHHDDPTDLPFDPATIDYVLLTHAHSDHAGRVPLLFRKGFRGRIIGTDATRALLRITLEQSLRIMNIEGKVEYTREDVAQALKSYLAVPYGEKVSPAPNLDIRLRDAGHILGSAMVELWIRDGEKPVKIVATGDMGSGLIGLLPPPDVVNEGDYVIVESTYGPFIRKEVDYRGFGREIRKTLLAGGSVLIPAFALDRTQKVLYVLGRLKKEGVIAEDVPIYTDSSSAAAITRVYHTYGKDGAQLKDRQAGREDVLHVPQLRQVKPGVSLAAHDSGTPAIFVTTSGMLDHGQAPRHLERMLADERNLVALVGWQAPGTLGHHLQQGAATVRIPPEGAREKEASVEKAVRLRVMFFEMFSGHADGCGILTWLAHFPRVKRVFVVHGEKPHALGLAEMIYDNLGFPAVAPAVGDTMSLSAGTPYFQRNHRVSPCRGLDEGKRLSSPVD